MTDSSGDPSCPRLLLVPTPIGNLGDITLRAIDALRDADHVVAEDTRRTRKLLSHLGLDARRLQRLDANATEGDLDRVVSWMSLGATVALVTDAGTPSVSDPGSALVRRALRGGITVTSLPGASAVTAAVAASGLVDGPFSFVGFLPRQQGELAASVADLAKRSEPCVLFESPNRLSRTLHTLADAMPSREAVIARELTKVHEEFVRGSLAELAALERDWVGEVTVVLGPCVEPERDAPSDEEVDARIDQELQAGIHTRTIASKVAAWSGRERRAVYARVVERRDMRR